MIKTLGSVFNAVKESYNFIAMLVFVISGIYLLIIDGTDLSTKGLKRELRVVRVLGVLYILGSATMFILFRFM